MKQFNGRTAAITGAASGMGRALALALAREGCNLALADVSEAALQETAQLAGEGNDAKITTHIVDMADRQAVIQYAADAVAAHDAVHVLFNNAGVALADTVEQMKPEDFDWLMGINFWGVVHGCQAFLPYLRDQDEAHIVNTSSIFGVIAVPTQSAYNAAKFAVRGFTEALYQELRETRVNVSCVLPGGVKTNIVRSSRYYNRDNEGPTRDEMVARFESMAALTSDQAAAIILKGVKSNRMRILVGRDARLMDCMQRWFPERYPRILGWLTRRNRSSRNG